MKTKEILDETMIFSSSDEMAKMMYKDIIRLYITLSDVIRHNKTQEYKLEDVLKDVKYIIDKYADAKVDTKRITTQY